MTAPRRAGGCTGWGISGLPSLLSDSVPPDLWCSPEPVGTPSIAKAVLLPLAAGTMV